MCYDYISYENEEGRTCFSKYYAPKVEIKDFNVLIDGKLFFEIPTKNKEETYEAIIKMTKNNDYTTGNLLDYEYFKDQYKLIAIDLRKRIEFKNLVLKQKINFIEDLKKIMQQCSSLSDCNGIRTHNHLVRKRTLNHLAKMSSTFRQL